MTLHEQIHGRKANEQPKPDTRPEWVKKAEARRLPAKVGQAA
jgi:hypothetical protein